MAVPRPFKRTVRQFTNGTYAEGGRWQYIRHPKFASEPGHYIRAFLIIQKDLMQLLDYIEPSETNINCFSYRIHELYIRSCIEIEANFKAIFSENDYKKQGDLNMADYKKIEKSHFLSLYEIKLPYWREGEKSIIPFHDWHQNGKLKWYQDYHAAKHNRHNDFHKANLGNLLSSIAGLVTVLSAQFWTEDFSPRAGWRTLEGPSDGFEDAIGSYFRVKFPENLPADDQYEGASKNPLCFS